MIVLDLEWNYGRNGNKLMEVLQIGAVRIEQLGGKILDFFDCYIRPQVHDELDYGAKQLPELAQYLESDLCFTDAMAAFRTWCGEEQIFAAWGADDLEILNQNCAYWNIPALEYSAVYDFQMAFSHVLGVHGRQIALYRAVAYCKIPDTFTFHNALYDAVYTAMISTWLDEASLTHWTPRRFQLCPVPFEALPPRRTAQFPTEFQVLHHKTARSVLCPLCEQKMWVQTWRTGGEHRYYSRVSCPRHGRFLCRLTLKTSSEEQWYGILEVPVVTKALEDAYRDAKKNELIVCIAERTAKRKRRKKKRRTAEKQG